MFEGIRRLHAHLDLKDERQTFHSLRNTFVEVMEGAGSPRSTIEANHRTLSTVTGFRWLLQGPACPIARGY